MNNGGTCATHRGQAVACLIHSVGDTIEDGWPGELREIFGNKSLPKVLQQSVEGFGQP